MFDENLSEFDKKVIQHHLNNCTYEDCESCADWKREGFTKNN